MLSDAAPALHEDMACTVIDGSAVLVDARESLLYWLNPVASRIWELADGSRTVGAIASTLCDEFEVDPETALRDTGRMVQAFVAKGIFTLGGEDAGA